MPSALARVTEEALQAPVPDKQKPVPRKVRHALDLMFRGECRDIKAAAAQAKLSREHHGPNEQAGWGPLMFVYVISGGRRHVKIGHSKDVSKRLKGIQTGCPFTVRTAGQWKTTRAMEIERRAHGMLAKYRWAGEWFDVPVRVATLTVGMLVTANPCRNGEDKPVTKAIVFCRSCAHSGVIGFVPDQDAKFRCTKCSSREHVHVIDFIVNTIA